jgi:transposase-like protein
MLDPVVLTEDERSVLTGWARRGKTAQALALRSRIVLACAEPAATIGAVSTRLEGSRGTVSKWRSRFLTDRLGGLSDEPRPGRPRVITDEAVETWKLSTDSQFVDKVRDVVGIHLAAYCQRINGSGH